MSLSALLEEIKQQKIPLGLKDEKLFIAGNPESLDQRLLGKIKANKDELHAYFLQLERIPKKSSLTIKPIKRTGGEILSFSQRRLWLLEQLDGGSAYLMPGALTLKGVVDVKAMELAVNDLILRHEALRTSFKTVEGEPLQQIATELIFKLAVTDLSKSENQTQVLEKMLQLNASTPIDLDQAPLLRIQLVKLAAEEHVLLFCLHHIISDEWSSQLMIKELSQAYSARVKGAAPDWPELTVQYADYAAWQRNWLQGDVLEQQLTYWRAQLGEQHPVLELPSDYPRPAQQSFVGGRFEFEIPTALTGQLTTFCRQHGFTLFQVLLGGFQILLARYSGQNDIRVGVPIANRTRCEVEGILGCFINTQVLNLNITDSATGLSLLQQVKQTAIGAQAHQDVPFEMLVEQLNVERDLSHSPLFQVMFNLQQAVIDDQELHLSGLTVSPLDGEGSTAKFDLTLDIFEREGCLLGSLEYSSDLFKAETAVRITDHYVQLLRGLVSEPRQSWLQLPIVSAPERLLLEGWEKEDASYALEPNWLDRFKQQVSAQPEKIVATCDQLILSYRELDNLSDKVAAGLQQRGVGDDQVVALLDQRGLDLLVAMVGVIKSGAAWLPLDPNQPAVRWQQILTGSDVALVVTGKPFLTQAKKALSMRDDESANTSVVSYEDLAASELTTRIVSADLAQQLAYVLFTSGSTGTPKGVMVSREGMLNNMLAKVEPLGLSPSDVIAQTASQCFDISVWQMLTAPILGASLQIIADEVIREPGALLQTIEVTQISILEVVPSLMQAMLEEQCAGTEVKSLRWVLPTGEALPPNTARAWFGHYPNIPLMNAYGPAECADDVAFAPLTQAPAETVVNMPIGYPTANAALHVVDSALNRVPVGVIGELAVAGIGVSRGYCQDPQRTAGVFVPNPFGEKGSRLYLTGDLVKRLSDGSLEYLGRKDFQVKIRGYRIELGEIEAALEQQSGVKQAVVTASTSKGQTRLVGYVTGAQTLFASDLTRALKNQLPGYMVPALLMRLDALPLGRNGKVDRNALPEPDFGGQSEEYAAPQGELEQQLADVWLQLLPIEKVGRFDNFFELGGHSLLATRLVSQIRRELNKVLPLRTVFEAPVLADMVTQLNGSNSSQRPLLLPVSREQALPLSFSQQRLWLLEQLDGGEAYLMPGALTLTGVLDVTAMQSAVNDLMQRHEALRTSFKTVGGEPLQQIAAELTFNLAVTDLSQSKNQTQALQQMLQLNGSTPFDLGQAPLLRIQLVKLAAQEHVLLFCLHHIISDEWSSQLTIKELSQAYSARVSGEMPDWPTLTVQYADYAAWQRDWLQGEILEQQLAYWREQLGEQHPVLELPSDYPRPAQQSFAGASVEFALDESLSQRLTVFCRQHGFTQYQVLLGTFQLLLARYTGQEDIRVGVPIANRTQSEVEGVLGCFINTQVMRLQLDEVASVLELLQQVKQTAIGAQAYQDVPFEMLVDRLNVKRDLSHSPLFQVMFNYLQSTVAEQQLSLSGLIVDDLKRDEQTAKFDLTLTVNEDDLQTDVSFEYCTALFKEETITRFGKHYLALLSQLMTQPNSGWRAVNLLSEQESHQQLVDWNQTGHKLVLDKDMLSLFETQVEKNPDAIAAIFSHGGESKLTYFELNRQANQLAHWLIKQGVGKETLVALSLERDPRMLVSLLAIHKAGGGYLPIDPAHPATRRQYVLEHAVPVLLLTSALLQPELVQVSPELLPIVVWEQIEDELKQQDEENPVLTVNAEQLAYTLYTSGSTGKPKGVQISRGAFVNFLHAMQALVVLKPQDRLLAVTTLSFDIAGLELFLPLITGAQTVVASREHAMDADALMVLLENQKISVMQATPATWQMMVSQVNSTKQEVWSGLKVLCGGEALSAKLAEELLAKKVRLLNVYGPTETTVWSSSKWITGDDISIGKPIFNNHFYILDEALRPVPVGVAGDLYIGGLGLARGYLKRPELTAEAFIPNPFGSDNQQPGVSDGSRLYRTGDVARYATDGNIEYLGRSDFQVKIRGFRIELGEIEGTLDSHPAVKQTVVVAHEDDNDQAYLAAYVTLSCKETNDEKTNSEGTPSREELSGFLKERLPSYMVPSSFTVLDRFTLNSNGKVDRKALPEPDFSGQSEEFVVPQGELERQLADIWLQLLPVEKVGRFDNFFELGGNSLQLVKLKTMLENIFDVSVELGQLLSDSSLQEMAKMIGKSMESSNDELDVMSSLLAEFE
ncbi:MAG: amino acid adenylation domain-containing protein [Cycloclasticus sp.]